jgi:hypothetical protein
VFTSAKFQVKLKRFMTGLKNTAAAARGEKGNNAMSGEVHK